MKAGFGVWGWAVGGDRCYCVAWGALASQVGASTPTSSNCWVFCHLEVTANMSMLSSP